MGSRILAQVFIGAVCLLALGGTQRAGAQALDCGTPASGTLSGAHEEDSFTIVSNGDEHVSILTWRTGENAAFTAEHRMYRPDGVQMSNVYYTGRRQWHLVEPGEYTVGVRSDSEAAGSYGIRVVRLTQPYVCGEMLPCEEALPAAFDTDGIRNDSEWHTFELDGQAGEVVDILVTPVSGPSGFVPEHRVLRPDGIQLSNVYYTGRRRWTLPETGEHTVVVRADAANAVGDFEVKVWRLSAGRSCADEVDCGDLVQSELVHPHEIATYRFEAEAGERVSLFPYRIAATSAFVPEHRVLAPDGSQLANVFYENRRIWTVAETGTHTVVVRAGEPTGTFGLEMLRLTEPYACGPQPECGETIAGAIEPAGRMALVRLPETLVAGDVVQIETTRTGGIAGFEPAHRLRRPDGTAVGNVNRLGVFAWTVDSPGENTVAIVAADENTEGTYAFRWTHAGGQCPCDADADADGDGLCDALDNCPDTPNPDQSDSDGDLIGDACDACAFDPANDTDGDGVCGDVDVCPVAPDADQLDSDADGEGDACDACAFDAANDADGDDVCGDVDNCPVEPNSDQQDSDSDGIGDACDPCPLDATDMCDPLPPPPTSPACADAQKELAGKFWKSALKCGAKHVKRPKPAKFDKCMSKASGKLEKAFPDTVVDEKCPVQVAPELIAAVLDEIVALLEKVHWTGPVDAKHEAAFLAKTMQLAGKSGESVIKGKGLPAKCQKKFTRITGKASKQGMAYTGSNVCTAAQSAADAIGALVTGM